MKLVNAKQGETMTTMKALPTMGAMKAAKSLIDLNETTIFSPGAQVRIAEIIDRDTAGLEILESLEEFIALSEWDSDTVCKTGEEFDAMVARGKAAIHKARTAKEN